MVVGKASSKIEARQTIIDHDNGKIIYQDRGVTNSSQTTTMGKALPVRGHDQLFIDHDDGKALPIRRHGELFTDHIDGKSPTKVEEQQTLQGLQQHQGP
ncbi:hypothetical protein ACH5RR_001208 [Cinchona calisaya]|uniref:Uncharacterized protein n=1 Tax=Cinchona calisaya TaxID=153742 RepID=A0ABD3B2R4_9GENT